MATYGTTDKLRGGQKNQLQLILSKFRLPKRLLSVVESRQRVANPSNNFKRFKRFFLRASISTDTSKILAKFRKRFFFFKFLSKLLLILPRLFSRNEISLLALYYFQLGLDVMNFNWDFKFFFSCNFSQILTEFSKSLGFHFCVLTYVGSFKNFP